MRPLPARLGPPLPYAVILVASALYGWAIAISTLFAPGSIGPNLNGLGTDWMVFEAAARSALKGDLATIFDGNALTHSINAQFGSWLSAPLPFRPCVYPPSFLVLIAPFGLLSYLPSYLLFQLLSTAALAGALLLDRDRKHAPALLACALLCPAAAINAIDGQLAFFVGAVLVGGFGLVRSRPLLAGCMLGLLSVKPQFAFLVPVALIASGAWRTLCAMLLCASLLALVSVALFGLSPWALWLNQVTASLAGTDSHWVMFGRMWGNSVYTCAVLLGASPAAASMLQLASIAAGAIVVWKTFRSPAVSADLRLSVLLVATILAALHSGAYDGVLLVIAGLLWIARAGSESWRWLIVSGFWLMPLVSPPLTAAPGRLVPLLLVAFLALVLRESVFSNPWQATPGASANA